MSLARSTAIPSLILACLPALATSASASSDDAEIFALIDALKPVAEAIPFGADDDCDAADWGAIPTFADPAGDAGGDPSRDITGVAIAPLDTALLVRIDTAGAPPATAADFWIEVDYRKQQFWDLKFSLGSAFPWFDTLPEVGEGLGDRDPFTIADIEVGASCVEVMIPYAALDPLLPAVMQGQLSGAGARPWLRVRATTGEPLDFFDTEIDFGNAVGSFRLVTTPYTLDPPVPAGGEDPHETAFPFLDEWYLGQGSHGVGTHAGIPWAYDWHRVDGSLLPELPQRSSDNADNFSYGANIRAPESGSVSSLEDSEPDCTPYAFCGTPANFVFMEFPGDVGIVFSHTIPGSIPWQAADPVPQGAVLGRVGNSGSGSWAHLHHEALDVSGVHTPIALALTDVEVGLNPGPDDPWQRSFASWAPREGFFVERTRRVPSLAPGGLAALAVVVFAVGAISVAARRGRRDPR